MLSNHSYANGVEKWLDLSLQVATNLWLPVYFWGEHHSWCSFGGTMVTRDLHNYGVQRS